MIRQAIIAAGGFGTRLRPYTDTMPKPMIPILGKPMLQWRLEQFRAHGVTEFFFTLNYLPQVVMDYFGDGSAFGVRIQYLIEDQPLGTAGAIKKLASQLDQTFFYGYGDVLAFIDYTNMQKIYADKKNSIGMQHTQKSDDYQDADVVELGTDGIYLVIHPKPHAQPYENPVYRMQGSFILDTRIAEYIPDGVMCNLGSETLSKVITAGEKFYAYESDKEVVWVDTAAKWREVEEYLRKRNIK